MPLPMQSLAENEAIESAQDRMLDTVTAHQQQMLETMDSAGRALLAGLGETGREISDFVADRIRLDLDTQQAMLRCRTVAEVREVQVRYLLSTLDQVSGGARRLIGIGSHVATESLPRTSA